MQTESSPGRFCAPEDDSTSGDENGVFVREPTPAFSIQAPSGGSYSSSDSDDDDTYDSRLARRRASSVGASIRPVSALEVALAETTARLSQNLQLKAQRRVSGFQRELLDIETQERRAEQAAAQRSQQESNALAATDREFEARRAQDREQMISSLRTVHEQQAEQAARKVAELEAAERKEAEEQERARAAAKAKVEAAKAKVEAAKAKAQADAAAAVEAKAKRDQADAERLAAEKKQLESGAGTNKHGIRSIAPSAAEFQKRCAERLAAAKEAVKPFVEDRAMRDMKRPIDKFITLNVQQISATLEQVRNKAQALSGFISQHHDIQRTYALVTLTSKLISQCEVQITRLHSFAFPLAEVAVAVAAAHPDFIELLLARLHESCPLSVPMYYGFRNGGDDLEYLRLMKYKITEEEEKGRVELIKESTDEYMGRMQGYVMLYAAITQSDNPANPHGLHHAWEYLARLINSLPANRLTAAALDAFLKVAGYKMAAVYKGQFIKLLQAVDRDFLAELRNTNEPDARAVATRLQLYLNTRQFSKPPEGRDMPQYDASSYDRA
jgi:nucleoporin GLE1